MTVERALRRVAWTVSDRVAALARDLRDRWFWITFDLEVWYEGLPISGYCLREFVRTGDLGYLHDALRGLLPW